MYLVILLILLLKIQNFLQSTVVANWMILMFSGKVIRADINLDSDHKSKGFGTVQFETATEAINAVCILYMYTNLMCMKYC